MWTSVKSCFHLWSGSNWSEVSLDHEVNHPHLHSLSPPFCESMSTKLKLKQLNLNLLARLKDYPQTNSPSKYFVQTRLEKCTDMEIFVSLNLSALWELMSQIPITPWYVQQALILWIDLNFGNDKHFIIIWKEVLKLNWKLRRFLLMQITTKILITRHK